MLSAVFPDEIIAEIMTWWGGHRLGLTCSTLLARMMADKYVILAEQICPGMRKVVTSRLPNGIFHGSSGVYYAVKGLPALTLTYDRGAIRRIDTICDDGRSLFRREVLIRGYFCKLYAGMVWVGGERVNIYVSNDDFESAVTKYLDGKPDGGATKLPVRNRSASDIFPDTYWFCP